MGCGLWCSRGRGCTSVPSTSRACTLCASLIQQSRCCWLCAAVGDTDLVHISIMRFDSPESSGGLAWAVLWLPPVLCTRPPPLPWHPPAGLQLAAVTSVLLLFYLCRCHMRRGTFGLLQLCVPAAAALRAALRPPAQHLFRYELCSRQAGQLVGQPQPQASAQQRLVMLPARGASLETNASLRSAPVREPGGPTHSLHCRPVLCRPQDCDGGCGDLRRAVPGAERCGAEHCVHA